MSPHCIAYLPADLESDSLLYAAIMDDCHKERAGILMMQSAQDFVNCITRFLAFNLFKTLKKTFFPVTLALRTE